MTYAVILVFVLLLSPLVLKLASKQDKKSKLRLKVVFISILIFQLILGFFNWERFSGFGRSGFELSLAYPNSLLGLFFIISAVQILTLLAYKPFNKLVVVLNFINSILLFAGLIRLSSILGFQAVSLASIGAVFLVLSGNVSGLVFLNKDKNLLKKYPFKK